MAGGSIIHVEGVQILHLDFSNCAIADVPRLLDECGALVRSQPPGSAFTLSDFTGSRFDAEVTRRLREYTKANAPHVKHAAVVGVTGLKRAIYRAVLLFSGRTNLTLCDTLEEATAELIRRARAG